MIKVDIWSDIRCPFCYIGKKHFEAALERFEDKAKITVEWHSYQLDPSLETRPESSTLEYFVQVKQVSPDQARQMFAGAKKMAEDAGLQIDLEGAVLANSFKAHQLLQLAKEKGLSDEIKEALFRAHFSERKNIDDREVLLDLATSNGLLEHEVIEAFDQAIYEDAVRKDELLARQIGVKGVPFFVFNNKYAVSGAQPSDTFLEILQKINSEN